MLGLAALFIWVFNKVLTGLVVSYIISAVYAIILKKLTESGIWIFYSSAADEAEEGGAVY